MVKNKHFIHDSIKSGGGGMSHKEKSCAETEVKGQKAKWKAIEDEVLRLPDKTFYCRYSEVEFRKHSEMQTQILIYSNYCRAKLKVSTKNASEFLKIEIFKILEISKHRIILFKLCI